MTRPPIRGLRYRKSDATKAALDLERYANELGLTQKQRLWCQEMVMRCDGNASAAAKAAGVSLSSAGDYTANPRLQTFMQALRAAASGPVAEELELVLYEAAHSLARLTEIAEGRVPSEVKRSVPLMPNGGRIIHITSIHGERAEAGTSAYAMAKAALNQFCRGLAVELAPRGILVNAIAPGFIDTEMSIRADGVNELETEWFRMNYVEGHHLPLRRAGQPEEIAGVAAFLAGPDASYLTGQVITVDGGLSITF